MKKYFVNYNVNRQSEFTNAKEVVKFLNNLPDLAGVKVEVGTLEDDEWTSEKFIGGHEFVAGVR